ncbi:MAG TPA: prolyl oligopeptidase family serine peptidase, partial [Flavobacteriaceae bacterium]
MDSKYSLGLLIFGIVFNCQVASNQHAYKNYPKFDKWPVKDDYFGTSITDDYRNMENLKDTTVINWFKAQSEHTNGYLDNLPLKAHLAEQMNDQMLQGSKDLSYVRYADNGFVFYLKSNTASTSKALYFKKDPEGPEHQILDPATFKAHLKHEYTISYMQPSWNGKYILVALSYDGITGVDLVIVDVLNQRILPEIITHADPDYFLGVSWLPDSSGFLYLYIPVLDADSEHYMKNSSTVLYQLGEDPKKRHIVFSASDGANLTEDDLPIAKILSPNDRYMIGYRATSENYWEAHYAKIGDLKTGKVNWKPFYAKDEKIYADYGYFIDGDFVFVSGKDADNRTISSFKMKDVGAIKQTILASEKKDEVISSLVIANNTPFYTTSRYGVEAFLYGIKAGKDTRITLPYTAGDINIRSVSNDNLSLWVGLDGWTRDYTQYVFSNGAFKMDPLLEGQSYNEFKDFVVKELLVKSHDGIEVPVSLIYRDDLVKNGSNPTFVYTYGAYGESIKPFFSPIFLNWVYNGGIFAVPHIRGGGEKGDDWHRQGMKTLKYNSWKDIIACTEYLIGNNYTSKSKTVLYSSSAGAVSAGMAVIEQPDLFQVFIADVPMLNPLRSEARKRNASNYLEYG